MHHPDELDIKIIKELGSPNSPQWNVRESYANIADRLGIDEETVRKRIKRARELGSLPRWLIKVNPLLIGRQSACLVLVVSDEDRKPELISRIRRLQGVITILDFLGRGMMVVLYYDGDILLTRMTEQIGATCGSEPVVWRQVFPRPDIRMKRVDWEILEVMSDDARMDLQDVADKIGVTARTVQRRLAAMMEGRAIYFSGQPDYRRMTGLACNFLVFCPDTDKKHDMDRQVASQVGRIERSDTASKQHSDFVVACENPDEANKTLRWLKGIDGVEWVRMGIMREIFHVQDWLEDEIEGRVRH